MGGPCCPHFTLRRRGEAPPHSGWPGPVASQACSQGGDIAGGQAGPSLSWLGAPAPAPGHRHHQELGLAALPRPPARPRLGRLCCCPALGSAPRRHPRGPQPKPAAPGEESEEAFLSGAPAQERDTPPKRRRPSSEAWGPERRLRWGLCLLARLSTPATPRPQVPGQAACPELGHPQAHVHRPSSGPDQSPGDAASADTPSGPTAAPHLHAWLCSLGACAGWAAAHGRPCHPAACWPLLLLSRGGHPAGGRGIGFRTAGPKRPRPSTATSQTHPGSSPPSPATMENRKSDKGPARKLHAPPPSHPPRICHPIKA